MLAGVQVQQLRSDDKEIYWEGVEAMDAADLRAACDQRGLTRGRGTASGPVRGSGGSALPYFT